MTRDYRAAAAASSEHSGVCYHDADIGRDSEDAMKIAWFHLMPYRFSPTTSSSLPLGLGRSTPSPVRSREDPRALPRVPGRARVRGGSGLRRPLRQRAPQQRLRAHAVAQPHGGRPHPPDLAGRDHRARQQPGRLQSAPAGGRGVCHAGPALGGPSGGGVPGGHVDGHELRVRHRSVHPARSLLRGPRPGHAGVDAARGVRVQRQVHASPAT